MCKVTDINSETRVVTVQLSSTSFRAEFAKGKYLTLFCNNGLQLLHVYSYYIDTLLAGLYKMQNGDCIVITFCLVPTLHGM